MPIHLTSLKTTGITPEPRFLLTVDDRRKPARGLNRPCLSAQLDKIDPAALRKIGKLRLVPIY
jgi:hypothetical protein